MPELDFKVEGAEAVLHSVSPMLALKLRITKASGGPVRSMSLRCQVRIESSARSYGKDEQRRLADLFGEPSRWNQTLRSMLWTHTSVVVSQFDDSTMVDLPIPCTFDFTVASAKFFDALENGEVPLVLLFSGTIFHESANGGLQAEQIPWNKEAVYRLPVSAWKEMMEVYYPNSAWLCLRKDVFDRLHEYKMSRGIPTWEQTLESLSAMNLKSIEKVANAVLYEGYLLYPYRASSVKNQQRFNFGVLYPEGCDTGYDTNSLQTECLIVDRAGAVLDVKLRFLVWDQRAHERDISVVGLTLPELAARPVREEFERGELRIEAVALDGDLYRVGVHVRNTSRVNAGADRDAALARSMISVHTILTARGGDFVSLLDPPEKFNAAAAECRNIGTWPVLAGSKGEHDAMLSSPIVLYDYPEIAPESAGDLFDSTEIDKILSLRIMTLTDEEKKEIREGDERARAILERTEQMPEEQLLKLHGALRGLRPVAGMDWDPFAGTPRKETVRVFGVDLKKGDRVRLWPQKSADILDSVLAGKTATIEAIEEDFDGKVHFAVVVDDDPGRDLGELRQPGHRFFFGADEVEPVE